MVDLNYAGIVLPDGNSYQTAGEYVPYSSTVSTPISDASVQNLAPEYDPTSTYSVKDWCVYNGVLYQCNTAISTPEAFDSTKWSAKKIVETTGSDIPVSSGETETIAEAIGELADYSYESKTCLISLGTGSSLTLNVQRYGKLVIASFTGYMTNSATVSAGDILFDGLPLINDFSEVFYITGRGRFRIYNDGNEAKVRIYDLQSVNAYIGFTLSYISP